ncbi:helix-turn-helix domain-containing protein [Paenibacillus caseinilyticus]|uniref:helix-turn-helix domain-containing protein n=1 Tax=Paenibacillus mucilaginosus TaxID=61624 RepID=UPI000315A5F3|nr:AraC family transcriptional regulator [Paenibacillus mucilaginosus]
MHIRTETDPNPSFVEISESKTRRGSFPASDIFNQRGPSLKDGEAVYLTTGASAGTVVYGPGGTYGPRVQQDLQLVLLHSGSMSVEIDGKNYSVPSGHTALLKPGRTEHFFFDPKRETWHRWIAVHVEAADSAVLQRLDELPFSIPLSEHMDSLCSMVYSLLNSGTAPEEELMKSLGESAILLYIAECERLHANETQHPAVVQAKEIIHQRFAEELSLDDLAKAVHRTPEHLIRLFRRDQHMTPIQYLWSYRVKQGLALISSTGLHIGEIAEQVGFKSSYHFARTIRRHTGKTPSEIRRESYAGIVNQEEFSKDAKSTALPCE